jgi:predicted NAD-dependent protein-ADP-ribosyltransferase YbiA (DUF1768 family)
MQYRNDGYYRCDESVDFPRVSLAIAPKAVGGTESPTEVAVSESKCSENVAVSSSDVEPALGQYSQLFQFFSKSSANDDLQIGLPLWRRILSNFHLVGTGDGKEGKVGSLQLDGRTFKTVEHYFQAAKYTLSGASHLASHFEVGGKYGGSASTAKKMGGRKAFESQGYNLDVALWNKISNGVMWAALCGRAATDEMFQRILTEVHKQHIMLLHFERSGSRSYWGGSISKSTGLAQGKNRLGCMLMELGRLGALEGYDSKYYSSVAICQLNLDASQQIERWTALAKECDSRFR